MSHGYATSRYSIAAHNHAAADIASGTIAPARLGSGTADNTKFLRGDQAWAAAPVSGFPLRLKGGGTTYYDIPGVGVIDQLSLWTVNNRDYVEPFIVAAELTISHICVLPEHDVDDIRIAIYTADENGQPVTLVAESGAISSGANTLIEYATTQVLAAGRYCFVHNQQTAGALHGFRTDARFGFRGAINSGAFIERVYSTRTFGAFTGQDWDTPEAFNYDGFVHHCFVKVSDIS